MIKRILGMLSLLLIVVLGLIACSTGTGEAMLEDIRWILESYGKPGNLKAVIVDTAITAEFVSDEEAVKGSAGCNSYFGSYELRGSQLSIPGPIGVTEMYCMEPKGVMDQEQKYLAVLQLVESYEINGNELQINCGSQVLIFKSD
ncbi:META domain-containing protein [Chloroflexota bacterium]